ncbi:hypothetical protein Hypma_005569 [Hypsizygus marmoreus]|uniref:Uncharacterized protein n=1 Tax=Hypsizygus marmoreus TaxID=39966 RepID=A0A369K4B1_HYPMA|nr:hypothetical protein Hypma_005569 [Hypsizygus marmoreus]
MRSLQPCGPEYSESNVTFTPTAHAKNCTPVSRQVNRKTFATNLVEISRARIVSDSFPRSHCIQYGELIAFLALTQRHAISIKGNSDSRHSQSQMTEGPRDG